jgi:TIR domain
MPDRIFVFISHISEEAAFANSLKSWIEATFPDQVLVFVSSDLVSIQAGEEWYEKIMDALDATSVFVVVCSPSSLERPWVNFETGVAAYRRVRIIPVCHRGMIPSKLPQPLHRFQGIDLSHATMPSQLMTPIATMLAKKLHAIPEAGMLAALRKASEQSSTSEKNIGGSPGQLESTAALSALSAVRLAGEVATQARFDDETVKLLQNGNSVFHEAASRLIDEIELRVKSIVVETAWDIKHAGDSHSEYVCYAQGYTFQLLPINIYLNTAHNASIRVRFFKGRLLSMIERQTLMIIEEPNELSGYQVKLTRTQKFGWCWKIGDRVLQSDRAAEQIITSFVLLIEKEPS